MKLGPVTKLDKRNTSTPKKCVDTSCRQILTSLFFLQITANLQPSWSWIPDAWSGRKVIINAFLHSWSYVISNSTTQFNYTGKSRIQQDVQDFSHLTLWLESYNPYDIHDKRLWSCSSGPLAQDGVGINYDDVNTIVRTVQKSLDNTIITRAKISRSK